MISSSKVLDKGSSAFFGVRSGVWGLIRKLKVYEGQGAIGKLLPKYVGFGSCQQSCQLVSLWGGRESTFRGLGKGAELPKQSNVAPRCK